MKRFQPREREYDDEGLCLTHGQHMLLEPCYKCVREDWNDLMSERDRYREALETLFQITDPDSEKGLIIREAMGDD